eukprot:TRINITY_DN22433_c0_g1_i1.p1 TRINITY_DN22433_c0_g1~~TRINITY_DN22433_c0_g1_i1.p1  ORF type:complete len:139 (-),score=24.55 TRINITY_DN22433_c0_g1_i1:182-598(-)
MASAALASRLYRIAMALLLFMAFAHTVFAMLGDPVSDEQARALSETKATSFVIFGWRRTYFDFYYGNGMLVTVLLVLLAFLCWEASGLVRQAPTIARRLAWPLAVSMIFVAYFSWTRFVIMPAIVSSVITSLLVVAAI